MVSAVSLETNQHQDQATTSNKQLAYTNYPWLVSFWYGMREWILFLARFIPCHILGFACSMLGKSKQTIFPNGGEQRWWIPWLESVKKHKNKSKKPNKPINQTKPKQNKQTRNDPYCWWLKSCTTWDVWNLKHNGKNYVSTGAGFQPSTVVSMNQH